MEEIEIPEAIREGAELPRQSRLASSVFLMVGIICCLGIAGLLSLWFLSRKPIQPIDSSVELETADPKLKEQPQQTSEIAANLDETQTVVAKPKKVDLLGHLPYDVAPESELKAITADNSFKMRSSAANKFQQMQAAARAEGVNLSVISAFRDDQAQSQLFFGVKEQRGQDAAKRAEVSAPPGYSEHHTGYAIDLGDGNAPGTNLETSFADTAAFRWLSQNALKYSFELSFPPNNKQGVSYEPWHWRFVGDRQSLETFYKVRN